MLRTLDHLSTLRDIEVKKLSVLAIASFLFAACGNDKPAVEDSVTASDSELTGNRGQVLSVVQVQGYTYIEVRNPGCLDCSATDPDVRG